MRRLTVVALVLFLASGCAVTGNSRLGEGPPASAGRAGLATQEIETRALRDLVSLYLDLILGLLPTLSESKNLLLDELDKVYYLVVSGGGGGCPSVAVDPPVFNGVPTHVFVIASYGEGCTASDGSTMAGTWSLELSNISQTATHFYLDYLFTATNLSRNGVVMADGAVSGTMGMDPFGDGHKVSLVLNSQGFRTMGWADLRGGLTVELIGLVADLISFHTYIATPAELTLAYNMPLLSGEYVLNSGNVTAVRQGDTGNLEVTADLVTSGGPVQGTFLAESPAEGSYLVNTAGAPFSIGGYKVGLENLVLVPGACAYPLGGGLQVSKGSEAVGVDFPETCEGTYELR